MGKKGSTAKKFAIGAGIAAAAGYLAGILTAPQSGQKTRKDIKDTAKKTAGQAEKDLKKLQAEVEALVSDLKGKSTDVNQKTKQEFNDLVDKAKSSRDKAGEVLAALKNGEADDKELQRALAEANKALDHLRKFLKK